MTDEELQAIEERANKASTAPWIVEADEYSGRNWLIGALSVFLGGSNWDNKSYFVTTKDVHASELTGDARTDAEFIAAARTDIPALVAEVKRLRADRERLLDDATDRIGYTEYVLSSGAWATAPRHMLPVSYRDWVAAGKPEEVSEKAVSA